MKDENESTESLIHSVFLRLKTEQDYLTEQYLLNFALPHTILIHNALRAVIVLTRN